MNEFEGLPDTQLHDWKQTIHDEIDQMGPHKAKTDATIGALHDGEVVPVWEARRQQLHVQSQRISAEIERRDLQGVSNNA